MLPRQHRTTPARAADGEAAAHDAQGPAPADKPESMASVPDRWAMAVRSPSLGEPRGDDFCEWQLIAIHGRKTTPLELRMFWWHATKRETETAVAEIGPLLARGMVHDEHAAKRIADLYRQHGMQHGPARAMMKIDSARLTRSIPDADPQHFQRAIDMLPDPNLDAKNQRLDAEQGRHEAGFNLSVGIDDSDRHTGVAVYSRPGSSTTTTVTTRPAPTAGPAPGNSRGPSDPERDEDLIASLARELLRTNVPRRTVENAVEAWRAENRHKADGVD